MLRFEVGKIRITFKNITTQASEALVNFKNFLVIAFLIIYPFITMSQIFVYVNVTTM
jgi:hypothetical protein